MNDPVFQQIKKLIPLIRGQSNVSALIWQLEDRMGTDDPNDVDLRSSFNDSYQPDDMDDAKVVLMTCDQYDAFTGRPPFEKVELTLDRTVYEDEIMEDLALSVMNLPNSSILNTVINRKSIIQEVMRYRLYLENLNVTAPRMYKIPFWISYLPQ